MGMLAVHHTIRILTHQRHPGPLTALRHRCHRPVRLARTRRRLESGLSSSLCSRSRSEPPPPAGVAHQSASSLLREQLDRGRHGGGGYVAASAGGGWAGISSGPPRMAPPPRPAGGDPNANRSAAELLRQQLMGRR